ncbi:MAG: hypothetical protein KAI47_27405, partial [Deltaproteobacteria bacterium]|nr:hypothetical protein [Deltaproteobacteria bacterium]
NSREAGPGVSRNQNTFRLKLVADADRFAGVAELDFAYYGYAIGFENFDDVYRKELLDAFRVEARSAYIEATDLFVEGLDLRIGQQVVSWGVGDQFNPTNVLNSPDLEDPLLFGEQLANMMVKLDYSPHGNFIFSAVLVPVFRPALLPRSSPLGLASADRIPYTDANLRYRIEMENGFVDSLGYPTIVDGARIVMPDFSAENMQGALRVAGNVGGQDLALMFYYGRFAFPQSHISVASLDPQARCNPLDPTDCISGSVNTLTGLTFPRFWMLGFNATGELPNPLSLLSKKIKGIGYRLELGVYFPQKMTSTIIKRKLDFGSLPPQPAGEYAYPGGERPVVVSSTPFPKWTLGLDYTFTSNVYLNVQWVHGLVDEFGAGGFFSDGETVRASGVDTARPGAKVDCMTKVIEQSAGIDRDFSDCTWEITRPRIADYLVAGLDLKFLDQKGLFRLFVIWDLIGVYESRWSTAAKARVKTHHGPFTAEGFSLVVFPELTYNFGRGFELSAGALLQFGKPYSKFGDAAAGGHQIWTRARFTF